MLKKGLSHATRNKAIERIANDMGLHMIAHLLVNACDIILDSFWVEVKCDGPAISSEDLQPGILKDPILYQNTASAKRIAIHIPTIRDVPDYLSE